MTKFFVVLLSVAIWILYSMLYGHTNNTLGLAMLHSRLEAHLPVWSIKLAIILTTAGWLVLIMQNFAKIQGTIWAVITILVGAFSTWIAWSIIWGFIDCPIIKFIATLSCAICSFGISLSLGSRGIK